MSNVWDNSLSMSEPWNPTARSGIDPYPSSEAWIPTARSGVDPCQLSGVWTRLRPANRRAVLLFC